MDMKRRMVGAVSFARPLAASEGLCIKSARTWLTQGRRQFTPSKVATKQSNKPSSLVELFHPTE